MPFDPREAQTRIKHGILGEYVGAWAGIITNGLRRRVRRGHAHADFVYLDGFSGPGLYESDLANPPGAGPVEGSPLIGIRSLLAAASIMTEVGLVPRFTAVLVEKRREWADELLGVVEQAGFSLEVAPVSTVAEIQLGRINVLQADFRDAIGPVLGSLPPHAWLLALIDPFGPSMRMSALAPLLRRRNTDAIIFFPSHWVQVRGGSRNKFLENWTDTDWENIRRLDQLFGSERWQEIAMKAGTSAAERIDRYAHLYKSQLDALGRKIFIKSIGLRFSASPIETAGYHLFLVTGNADGAMRMTDILRRKLPLSRSMDSPRPAAVFLWRAGTTYWSHPHRDTEQVEGLLLKGRRPCVLVEGGL